MKIKNKKIKKIISVLIIGFICSSISSYAEKTSENQSKSQTTDAQELSQPLAELQSSITGAIEQEESHLGEITKSIVDEKTVTEKLDKEIGVYKILISSAQNLLIIPDTDIDILEKNSEELGLTQTELEEKQQEINANSLENKKNIETTNEKIQISQKQIDSIKKEYGKEKDIKQILKMIEDLNRIRNEKLKALNQLDVIYEKQIKLLSSVIEPYSDLAAKVEEKLRVRKQEVLFERNHNIVTQLKPAVVLKDLKLITNSAVNFFTKDFWQHKFSKSASSDIYSLIFHILAILFSLFILRTIKSHLKLRDIIPPESRLRNIGSILFFIDQAFVLGTLTASLFIYERFKEFSGIYAFLNPVQRISASLLTLYLFSSALDIYLKNNQSALSQYIIAKKPFFIRFFYIFSSLYILIEWISGSGSTILLISRLFLEIAAVICFTIIWKNISKENNQDSDKKENTFNAVKWAGYTITGAGLILEIAGYGYLTIHWYQGWIITATVTSLIYFCLNALKEWDDLAKDKEVKNGVSEGSQSEKHSVYPLYWLGIRVLSAIVFLIGIGTVAYICGAREKVFEGAWGLITQKVEIGGTKFSISNTVLAFFVILLTQTFTRIWRSLMMGRILKNSGIESGLKDSITTISSYLIWGLGILTAMHAFGLSTTSLTVGFGALGIGLGFGLQNIFNNFISGLILLFERPIQVGDVVEINNVMGMVTKINVRSTLVQTYSNASFIIPNSEFISNRVINWSHKDPYIKRDVKLGVAYGSDTQKVRSVLLEAADAVPEILNFPMAPSVSFIDFGDSSLDFKIKFWTTIDDFSAAESTLRFEIEKRFRENEISIPFPQREIKIIKE